MYVLFIINIVIWYSNNWCHVSFGCYEQQEVAVVYLAACKDQVRILM